MKVVFVPQGDTRLFIQIAELLPAIANVRGEIVGDASPASRRFAFHPSSECQDGGVLGAHRRISRALSTLTESGWALHPFVSRNFRVAK